MVLKLIFHGSTVLAPGNTESCDFIATQKHRKTLMDKNFVLDHSEATVMDSEEIARTAKAAFQVSQLLPSSERINALLAIRKRLELQKSEILAANVEDLKVRVLYNLFFFFVMSDRTSVLGCSSRGGCWSHVRILAK